MRSSSVAKAKVFLFIAITLGLEPMVQTAKKAGAESTFRCSGERRVKVIAELLLVFELLTYLHIFSNTPDKKTTTQTHADSLGLPA
jgi:hypothetical protein